MPLRRGSVPEGRCDRSLARSAWNGPTPEEPSRRARYDRAQTQSQRYFASKCAPCFLSQASHSDQVRKTGPNQTVPYGTAPLRWRCPRHFVPGYDRTVPPGLGGKAPFGFGTTKRLKLSLTSRHSNRSFIHKSEKLRMFGKRLWYELTQAESLYYS